jgi:DNA-binding NarL/FixJ family response regulator
MKNITVLLCDDHNVVREGLRFLLEAADDIHVVGEAENGHQAVREAKRLLPDVVLLDLAMPLLNGVGAARQITRKVPSTKVLILSGYSDDQHVVQAIEAGATGYLMKETAGKHLLQAVREAYTGNPFFSSPVSTRLLRQYRERLLNGQPARTTVTTLTRRQTEVLQLVAEGYSTKRIAGLLAISIKTVEKHRSTLMEKLEIHEVATLTRYAISSGLIESGRVPVWPVTFAQASPLDVRQNPALSQTQLPRTLGASTKEKRLT